MRTAGLLLSGLLLAGPAWTDPGDLPRESGVSGTVGAVAYSGLADTHFLGGHAVHSGLSPVLDLRYTFGQARTQLFAGDDAEELLRLDHAQQAGVRHQCVDGGMLSASLTGSVLADRKVPADPYATVAGGEVRRTSRGVRLGWDSIGGGPFNLQWSRRSVRLDHEDSGTTAGVPADVRSGLDRNGTVTRLEAGASLPLLSLIHI